MWCHGNFTRMIHFHETRILVTWEMYVSLGENMETLVVVHESTHPKWSSMTMWTPSICPHCCAAAVAVAWTMMTRIFRERSCCWCLRCCCCPLRCCCRRCCWSFSTSTISFSGRCFAAVVVTMSATRARLRSHQIPSLREQHAFWRAQRRRRRHHHCHHTTPHHSIVFLDNPRLGGAMPTKLASRRRRVADCKTANVYTTHASSPQPRDAQRKQRETDVDARVDFLEQHFHTTHHCHTAHTSHINTHTLRRPLSQAQTHTWQCVFFCVLCVTGWENTSARVATGKCVSRICRSRRYVDRASAVNWLSTLPLPGTIWRTETQHKTRRDAPLYNNTRDFHTPERGAALFITYLYAIVVSHVVRFSHDDFRVYEPRTPRKPARGSRCVTDANDVDGNLRTCVARPFLMLRRPRCCIPEEMRPTRQNTTEQFERSAESERHRDERTCVSSLVRRWWRRRETHHHIYLCTTIHMGTFACTRQQREEKHSSSHNRRDGGTDARAIGARACVWVFTVSSVFGCVVQPKVHHERSLGLALGTRRA